MASALLWVAAGSGVPWGDLEALLPGERSRQTDAMRPFEHRSVAGASKQCFARRTELNIFCWICSTRREFHLPQQSTLAVCCSCGNPEGAIRQLVPVELAIRGLEAPEGFVETLLSSKPG